MFEKAKDVILVVLIVLVLSSVVPTKLADELGVVFPEWTGIGNHRSQLEGRNYSAPPKVSVANIAEGKFQAGAEKYLSDVVPMRDNVLLANAALQRACIQTANVPLGFECYPTFFGSDFIYIPSVNALQRIPHKFSETEAANLYLFGSRIASIASHYPNVHFAVCAPLATRDPAVSPAYQLVSNAYLPLDKIQAIENGLGDCENVHLVYEAYDSLQDYYDEHFRTDHHWNWRGATRMYNQLADLLGLQPFTEVNGAVFENYIFSGSSARSSLDLITENPCDSGYDFSDLVVEQEDGSKWQYSHDSYVKNLNDSGITYKFYDWYYQMPTNARLRGSGAEVALIVSSSYGTLIAPYIAENYQVTTYCQVAPNYDETTPTLSNLINSCGADHVFLIANPYSWDSLIENHSEFFAS